MAKEVSLKKFTEVLLEAIERGNSANCPKLLNFMWEHGENYQRVMLNMKPLLEKKRPLNGAAQRAFTELTKPRYSSWTYVDSLDDIDYDKISTDGYGYVILDNKARVDIGSDAESYKRSREAFNQYKKEYEEFGE